MASAVNRIADSLHRRRDALCEAEQRSHNEMGGPTRGAQDAQVQPEEQTTLGEPKADKPGLSASRCSFILSVLAAIAVGITLIARRRPSGAGGQDAPEQTRGAR